MLAEALTLMHERGQDEQQKAEYHVINPKACTMGQLYGQVGGRSGAACALHAQPRVRVHVKRAVRAAPHRLARARMAQRG